MTRLNDASRQAIAELIARLANLGRDDPTIAAHLSIPVSQVRALRREFDIKPGETRWTPRHQPGGEPR